jgi:hypothetical protein
VTWLFVLLLWTACAALAAPLIGRALARADRRGRPARLPAPRPTVQLG